MRLMLLVTLATALAACTAADEREANSDSTAKTPPSFQFKKIKAGLSLDAAKVEKLVENCSEFEGMTNCNLADRTVAGFVADISSVQFKGTEFYNLLVTTNSRDYNNILNSLTTVYGKPCKVDSKRLQNAFGAEFSGDLVTWCFKEGEMSFLRHSRDAVTASEFRFDPTYKAPPTKPLTAETL